MNIYESINKIMAKCGVVEKDKRSKQGYMYRGIDQVMNALQPAMTEYSVFVVPEVIEHTREERKTKSDGNLIYSIIKMKYTFFAEDGTYVSAVVIGEGMDSGDKSSNKAMSVAFKYACFQTFCISTEEMKDPDDDTPPDNIPVIDTPPDNIPVIDTPPPDKPKVICPRCGSEVSAVNNKGKRTNPDDVVAQLGMCYECHKDVKEIVKKSKETAGACNSEEAYLAEIEGTYGSNAG